ncbi:MAG TPA: hypothetical protein VKA84_27850 [Gemmatimonadaceae bacterium]|nr:hypothetical protein [Gemmatimonadaceae bacterium]
MNAFVIKRVLGTAAVGMAAFAMMFGCSEGVAASAEVESALECTGAPPWRCQPAGLTALTDNGWTELAPSGWQHANRDAIARIVQDASAPFSPDAVLEQVYPSGYTGGGEPAIQEYDFAAPAREVFVGAWFKFSPGWQGHVSGINKIVNVMTDASYGRTWAVLRAVGERDTNNNLTDGPFFVDVAFCARYGAHPGTNRNATPVEVGRWHKLEWQIKGNTPGRSDGAVRWWVDGVLRGEYTGLDCVGSAMTWLEVAPTFGGLGDTKLRDDYVRFDHVYIATAGAAR